VAINQLHVPVGKTAVIRLSSKDVIHSFFLPVMRVKQDVIPGMSIPIWFDPIVAGKSEIACAQLCGLGHYRMKGFLTVHEAGGYEAWLAQQAAELAPPPEPESAPADTTGQAAPPAPEEPSSHH
jgi:cytochrome c oxidase subunit 2